MKAVCNVLTVGEIGHRAENWFDWDEIRLKLGVEFFPLQLGFHSQGDDDWTSVEDFLPLLDQADGTKPLLFRCDGKLVGVVGIEDEGEPFLIVEEV
jgi:hypothetical protein